MNYTVRYRDRSDYSWEPAREQHVQGCPDPDVAIKATLDVLACAFWFFGVLSVTSLPECRCRVRESTIILSVRPLELPA